MKNAMIVRLGAFGLLSLQVPALEAMRNRSSAGRYWCPV